MSDDFGTVSVKRGDRAREIEVLRQQYRAHRESLSRLVADAPTEALAAEYQKLIASIDGSMRKLDELEGGDRTLPDFGDTQRMPTSAGMRPLAGTNPPSPPPPAATRYDTAPPVATPNPTSRMLLIVLGGIVVLGIIGWLIYRASNDRKAKTGPITETTVTTVTNATGTEPPITPAPSTETASTGTTSLKITPAVNDYGVIRKGTRVVRQYVLTYGGTAPITIEIARSKCRCLFYEYNPKVQPGKKETITVAVDGARAKAGALDEQIAVSAKGDPAASATLEVRGTVK